MYQVGVLCWLAVFKLALLVLVLVGTDAVGPSAAAIPAETKTIPHAKHFILHASVRTFTDYARCISCIPCVGHMACAGPIDANRSRCRNQGQAPFRG